MTASSSGESVANVAFGVVAEGNGVGHILVVVPEPTRDLEEFATSVVGFELAVGAAANMGRD